MGTDFYVKPALAQDCPLGDQPCKTLDEYAENSQNFSGDVRLLFLPGIHKLTTNLQLGSSRLHSVMMMPANSILTTDNIIKSRVMIQVTSCNVTVTVDSIPSLGVENLSISGADNLENCFAIKNIPSLSIYGVRFVNCPVILAYGLESTTPNVNNTIRLSSFEQSPLTLTCDPYVRLSVLTLIIQDSILDQSNGTGLYAFIEGSQQYFVLDMINCNVSRHQQGGIIVNALDRLLVTVRESVISDNVISHNGRGYSAALSVLTLASNATVIIINSHFIRNQDMRGQPIESAIYIGSASSVMVTNGEFRDNRGTAIRVTNVRFSLVMSGHVNFVNNSAPQGGALVLAATQLHFLPGSNGTHIKFEKNSASDVGGAIYVEHMPTLYEANDPNTFAECFYYFPHWGSVNYAITFKDNLAENGGDDIFGASLKSYCVVGTYEKDEEENYIIYLRSKDHTVQQLFTIKEDSTSSISSPPSRVCIIHQNQATKRSNEQECANSSQIFMTKMDVIPGEEFHLKAILTGVEFGTTTGEVYAQLLTTDNDTQHTFLSHLQRIDSSFAPQILNYTLFSNGLYEILVLSATAGLIPAYGDRDEVIKDIEAYEQTGIIPANLLTTPVFVNITLQKCPICFYLDNSTLGCKCNVEICSNKTRGHLANGTGFLTIGDNLWINASNTSNNDIVIHHECPFNYCRIDPTLKVDLDYPDTQCAMNRAGTLCGACANGLSLAIGSNECLRCRDNRGLLFLFFFAAAGFLLVIFIKVLNLTVSQGTINGLIFYANIMWAYQSILSMDDSNALSIMSFLNVFIAWLNLDFGIEICFFQGLTAFWKTWLQFLFPLYIWSIAGVMILLARYSERMTRLLGNNSVQVLATLFLLSYAKLLRTIITVLTPAKLYVYTERGEPLELENKVVWAFDGSLAYGSGRHLSLLVVAILVLIFLWLPYTLVLLFIKPLRSMSHYRCLNWVNTGKPFFDAYVGPLKSVNHFWIGLLLLARLVLLLSYTFTYTSSPLASLLVLNVTILFLFTVLFHTGQLYEDMPSRNFATRIFPRDISARSTLEVSFLLNLAVVAASILYVEGDNRISQRVVCVSIIVAFLKFIAVVVYHSWSAVVTCIRPVLRHVHGYQNLDRNNIIIGAPTTTTVDINRDRESQVN